MMLLTNKSHKFEIFSPFTYHNMSSFPINNLNLKEKKHNKKIRKIVCSSTSSFSASRTYRFKRAILVGKKGGYSTPPPVWKTATPSMATHHHHHTKTALPSSGFKQKQLSDFSARELGATLWEINDLQNPSAALRSSKDRDKAAGSDPFYSPFSEMASDKLKDKKNSGRCTVGLKKHLKEARSGLSTSKKILKVLSQVFFQEQHSSSIPLILAMSSELDRVCYEIDQLIQQQSSNHNDIEYLMKHFAEEKNAWKRREREKIRKATMSIAQELEVEKKLRRQTERLNEKIAKEMSNAKASYSKMFKELEREKRAKEILEQVCDELAKGIGEDKAQVEEMKRESEIIREEVEKEREMLQLANDLREEKAYMKLSEAKYQFEEKNAVLEKLTNELENFFKSKEEQEETGDINPGLKKLKDLEFYLSKTLFQNLEEENELNVGDGIEHYDESAESDLQSIELSMDNDNKSYKWSYACENFTLDDAKRVSIDRDIGRKSFSWGSICFNKGTVNTKKMDFLSDQLERETSIEFHFGDDCDKKDKEGTENHRPKMSLRDYMSRPASAQESGQSLTLLCLNEKAGENTQCSALEGCS